MTPASMRAALLHGVGDLRVETVPVPQPGPGEVLVRVEACGICPTDARKFAIGTTGGYPLNPGHEWVGRVVAGDAGAGGPAAGERVYGDTYAGYAEYAAIAIAPEGQSRGALPLGELSLERAVFVEPLADCLHAVHDQAQLGERGRAVVLGAGSMGLQMVAAAARAGARVLAVEPREERRRLAERFGAETAIPAEGWQESCAEWTGGSGPEAIIVTVGHGALAAEAVAACGAGGRVVLFAGFGDEGRAEIDLNRLHYEEISLVGSEWVGVPPYQRLEHYEQARDLLAGDDLPLDELISDRVGLDEVADALRAVREQRSLKTVLYPAGTP